MDGDAEVDSLETTVMIHDLNSCAVLGVVVAARGEQLRGLLALMVLAVCIKIMFDLAVVPEDLLSVELLR